MLLIIMLTNASLIVDYIVGYRPISNMVHKQRGLSAFCLLVQSITSIYTKCINDLLVQLGIFGSLSIISWLLQLIFFPSSSVGVDSMDGPSDIKSLVVSKEALVSKENIADDAIGDEEWSVISSSR